MDRIKSILQNIREKSGSFFKGSNVLESKRAITKKQWINLSLVVITGFTGLVAFLVLMGIMTSRGQIRHATVFFLNFCLLISQIISRFSIHISIIIRYAFA